MDAFVSFMRRFVGLALERSAGCIGIVQAILSAKDSNPLIDHLLDCRFAAGIEPGSFRVGLEVSQSQDFEADIRRADRSLLPRSARTK